ncbi:Uncharacterized protein PAE221_00336 [Pseudomonas aeruginosa]|nr:Uncharacterized protein PAE221_00336 [Pseudomonas aeruginosa]
MRRVLQRVVFLVQLAAFHRADFLADADHRVAETIQLGLRLALGGLDHQRAGHREGHGRRMEAEVHQALGHVVDADPAAVLERTQVEDAFVGDQAVAAGVEHRVVLLQAMGDVVGIEDGHFRGALEAFAAHHADVHPGDRQDARAAVRRRAHRAFLALAASVAGEERRQVRAHADRADARAAAAVGDAEGLVQVQVGNVATELARGAQADHGVHVGAVDVHLATAVVDDGADLADRFLEHAVGGRIGDHQRGQAFLVLAGLVAQVLDVDVAARVAGHHHHAHADHAGGSRVGTVGGGRDQTDVALAVAAALVVGTDRQQAGVLALGAGVGLQRHGVVAGGGTEHRLQFVGELAVAFALLGRGERVQVAEFGPGHRDHLAGGVQLHGAGAQRDHRAVQRQVLVRQLAQVAHQLGFRVMAVEDRVAEDRRLAQQLDWQAVPAAGGKGGEVRERLALFSQQAPERFHVGLADGLVERQAETAGIDLAQVDPGGAGLGMDRRGTRAGGQAQGVEEMLLLDGHAQALQAGGEDRGQPVGAPGDAQQALRAVVDGEHAGDVGQQHLGGADVAGGLLAADVLLAGLHGQAVGRLAVAVDGDADQASRHVPLEGVAGGEIGRVRAAEAERHAEALGAADGYVGAELARRGQQGQRQQVGGHRDQRIDRMEAADQFAIVDDLAVAGGVLQQRAEVGGEVFDGALVADHHLDAQRLGTGAQHVEGLRVAMAGGEECLAGAVLRQTLAEGHGLGGGGRLVEHRGVGDRQAGQVADQGLEVQQRLQAALGDFRLVRRVGGVPGRVLQEVAQDRCRGVAVVVALANEGTQRAIARGDRLQAGQRLGLAHAGRQVEHAAALDAVGDHVADQRVQRVVAQALEHGLGVGGTRADMAGDEFVVGAQVDGAEVQVIGHDGILRRRRWRSAGGRRRPGRAAFPRRRRRPDGSGRTRPRRADPG